MNRKVSKGQNRGVIALILVIWTTIGLSSLLYSLTLSYESILLKIKGVQQRAEAHSAALLCKDIITWRLSDDARYIPDPTIEIDVYALLANSFSKLGTQMNILSGNLKCQITDFISNPISVSELSSDENVNSVLYAEQKQFTTTGTLEYLEYDGVKYATTTLNESFAITLQVNGFPKNNIKVLRIQELSENVLK